MKEWFKARNIWYGAFIALSDAEAGRLAKALWTYTATGKEAELTGNEKGCYAMIRFTLQQDEAERGNLSEKRREAGLAGALAKQANASFARNEEANEAIATNKNKNKIIEEEEEERETDNYNRAREAWLASFGITPTPALIRKLLAVGLDADLTAKAIRVSAGKCPAKPVDYVLSVLNDWRRERIASEDEADEYLLLLDGAAGKVPAVFTPEQARAELDEFRQRKKAAS